MNSQKGFVGIFVLLVILAVAGVAGYYFISQKEGRPSTPTTQVNDNFGQNDTSLNKPQNEVNQLPVTSPKQQENPVPSSQSKPTQTRTSKPTPPATSPTPPPREINVLKSDFFKNDSIAQSILSGTPRQLSDNNFLQGGKINALSFEFKLINAFKQLGMAELTYSEIPGSSDATAAFYKWQKKNGLGVSNILTKEKMILIDQQVYERERKDYESAKNYPPYQKFAAAPSNEPSREHLAAIYYNLFSSIPQTVKATLALSTREEQTYSTIFNLEEFVTFIDHIGNPYFGSVFNQETKRGLSIEEMVRMVDSKIYSFTFCGEGYYARREMGNCLTLNSEFFVGGISYDIAHASMLAHEFGHSVGSHNMLINGVNKRTHEHFGTISFNSLNPENVNIPLRVENDGEFISQYAKTNYLEDFAESFSAYIHSGNIFRKRAEINIYLKQKYDFLKGNVFGGKEYNTGSLDSYYLWQSKNKGLPPKQDYYMQEDPSWAWDYKY